MASKKILSADITVKLLERLADGQDRLADRLDQTNASLRDVKESLGEVRDSVDAVKRNTADTADALRRLEKSSVGIGRVVALEERVRKLEEHAGIEPPR